MIQIPNAEPNANKSFYQLPDSQSCLNIVPSVSFLVWPSSYFHHILEKNQNKKEKYRQGYAYCKKKCV